MKTYAANFAKALTRDPFAARIARRTRPRRARSTFVPVRLANLPH